MEKSTLKLAITLIVSLVYRLYYELWPFIPFKDVNSGTFLERAAAFRHNIRLRNLLPIYVLKWSVMFLFFTITIEFFESIALVYVGLKVPFIVLASVSGVLAACALIVVLEIVVIYAFLAQAAKVEGQV